MTIEEKRAASAGLIYLAGCAVNKIKPDPARVKEMDLESVHELACSLSLEATSFTAVKAAYEGEVPDTPFFQDWEKETDLALMKEIRMDQERQSLFSWMEEQKIWHMPLKGVLLKDLYPQKGMRQMADNDILFDEDGRERIHDWFLKKGYEAESYQQGSHDVYLKKPFYNFELHPSLFYYTQDPLFQDYYRDVKTRLLPVPGKAYEYRFSEEDFYVYMTAHNCKHYRNGGIGLRALLDVYVYWRAKGTALNLTLIRQETQKLGIADYEEKIRELAQKLFHDPAQYLQEQLSEEEQSLLDEHISLGTYGTIENRVKNRLQEIENEEGATERRAKIRYIFRRLFPEPAFFQVYYPFFYRHRYLLPVGYLYRLVFRWITRSKKLSSEIKALRKL